MAAVGRVVSLGYGYHSFLCVVFRRGGLKKASCPFYYPHHQKSKIAKRFRKIFCGASRIAGFGEGTPQQDLPQGQNRRYADFGTVVESCSVTSAYCLFQFLSSAVRSAEWENGGFAKLFPSANTTVTNPPRARFCGNFFIFPFATTTVKGPAFSKSGNKKSSKSFQTYCFCCRCDGRLLFSFGTM